tara:strand:+ start:2070 stop:2219 length:150 start_codon:yes stop_codon:yes gene_type:complete
MDITLKEKLILIENIEGNTTWFNDREKEVFKSIKYDIKTKSVIHDIFNK